MLQAVAVPVIGSACHVFMHGLNHVKVYGAEKLHQALLQRPKGKPLLTVSNHVAAIDDPFVVASLLPPNIMLDAHNLRWTLCATDRCFSNPVLSAFFRCVKVLPVSRGDGIYQKGMDMALSKLNNGGWVHIFPEGSRSRDGGKTLSSSKRGVGRLVMDADSIPIVIPFVHTGMQEIMPVGTKFPKVGKQVTVVVGDPIYLEDLLVSKDNTQDANRGTLYDAVSSRIGNRLQELKLQAERLALEHQFEVEQYHMHDKRYEYDIWQQVDWEAFGMENVMSTGGDTSQIVKQRFPSQQKKSLEQSQKPESSHQTLGMGFSYDGGIMSRVRNYVNPSEFMGFAARGLFMNGQLLDEGTFNIQETGPVKAWKEFMNKRSSIEGHFKIQEAAPVKAWKQFVNERLPDEGGFRIQEAVPVKAWKQFFEGSGFNMRSCM
ncbi:tafazzin-like [Asparagus officinalis]|nr:tafazzin-like [Asparagus officinalis]